MQSTWMPRAVVVRSLVVGVVILSGTIASAQVNLALNKSATGSTSCNANEGPAKAVNGSVSGGNSDKWCTNVTPMWWQVDLGAAVTVSSFTIRHAGAGGESAAWNTRDFTIQTSADNATWTTVVTVTG